MIGRRVVRLAAGLAVTAGVAAAALVGLLAALRPPALPVPERRDHLFRDVTVIVPGRPPRPGQSIRVRDGRIAEVGPGPAGPGETVGGGDAGSRESALSGLYVMPGLVDMHVHYPPAVAIGQTELWGVLFLAHGVTSVRETGSIDGRIFGTRDAIRQGRLPGPRIFSCGEILDGDPPSFPTNRIVRTPAEGRAAVREAAARGATCVKVYNLLAADVLREVRRTAHALGLSLVGHKPHAVTLEEAGIDDLQHGTGAPRIDPALTGRLDFRLEDWQSVDAARIEAVVSHALANGTAHTLALVNPRQRLRLLEPGLPDDDSGLRHLPRFWVTLWSSIWSAPFEAGDARRRALHEDFRRRSADLALALHRAGATLHAGTDTLMPYVAPGSSLWGELDEWVRIGIDPEAALARATRIDPRFVGGTRLGRIEPGAPADLVFLRRDPRRDLDALRSVEAVLADGRLYTREDLDRALARLDFHFQGTLYRTVMEWVVALARDHFTPGD